MEKNFTWREVSEEERKEIKNESKRLLDEFALKLSNIKAPEGHFENGIGAREETSGWETDLEFREITFANAPFVDDNSIVAEKGEWK